MRTVDLPVIELSGAPRERGRIYGETAKSLIASVIERWRFDLGNFSPDNTAANPVDPDIYLNEFFTQTNYLRSIKRWTPDLLDEVNGIAEGSGQHFKDILGLQLLDEEWIFGLRRRLDKPVSKCTAFGVPNQSNAISYAGQNMDVPSWMEGYQVLLKIIPDKSNTPDLPPPEALVFSIAGNIGLNGINASGVGITCNTLPQLNYASDGLPVSFIVRSILQRSSIENAERYLLSIKHASGQNYILSTAGDMRCYECCATSVARYAPEELQGRVFHSNHPLVNRDGNNLMPEAKRRNENTVSRFNSIYNRLGNVSQPVCLDDIKAALSAHDDPNNPVSRVMNPDNSKSAMGYTAGSSIYEFGDIPCLHLAAGPPCETDFKLFEFSPAVETEQIG